MGLVEFSFLFFLGTVMLKAIVMFEDGVKLSEEEARILRQHKLAEARLNASKTEIEAKIKAKNMVRPASINRRTNKVTAIPSTPKKTVIRTNKQIRKAA